MKVCVVLEHRFAQTPDGRVWTDGPFPYSFWTRYLAVFDGVRVVARVRSVDGPPPAAVPADGAGVAFAPIPYFVGPWSYVRQAGAVRRAMARAIAADDAVILRVPSTLAAVAFRLLARRRQPYAVEVVGDPYDAFAPGAVRHPLRPFFRWRFARDLRRHCRQAAVAAYVTAHMLQRRYPPGPRADAASYSDVQLEGMTAQRPREYDGKGPARLVIVGSLAHLYKAQDVLLEALALCRRDRRDVRLSLVGDGPYRGRLQDQAAALGLQQHVQFLGQLTGAAAICAELDKADLFVLPSRQEGLPRAMIEAMARGLPCIGSTVGGFPELLPPEDMVPPDDAPALAAKLGEVLGDPQRMSRMSQRNLNVAQSYREDVLSQRRTAAYEALRAATARPCTPAAVFMVTVDMSVPFLRGHAAYLRGHGFDVHVIATPGEQLRRAADEDGLAIHGVSIEREIRPLQDLRSLYRLMRIFRTLRPVLVVAATPKASLLGMLVARLTGVPVRVYQQFGLRLETTRGLKRHVLTAAERLTAACASKVICCSRSLRDVFLSQRLAPPEKVTVLGAGSSHGVDAERFRATPERRQAAAALRTSCGIPAQALVIGFVGRLTRDKGIVELLEAFRQVLVQVPEAWLLIRGDFEPGDPVPEECVRQVGSHPRISVVPRGGSMETFYPAMDLLAFPSYREGLPNVPLEAAAAGIACAGFAATGTVDAVQSGVTGTLVELGDSAALARAITMYLQDPELRQRHAQAARSRIERDFCREVVWDNHYRQYRELMQAAGVPGLPAAPSAACQPAECQPAAHRPAECSCEEPGPS